ncbi:GrpB family protein [Micromonospora echinofusca]|uniref:GrpB family protein n=1 Tax=Micromonospora echinofusca TaxID=47858 RepID=UPI0034194E89
MCCSSRSGSASKSLWRELHLTEPTSLLWRRRIAFRDALRCRADHRSRYEQLKRDLAQAHGADLMAYARNKDDFVNEVLGVRDKTEAPSVSVPQRP